MGWSIILCKYYVKIIKWKLKISVSEWVEIKLITANSKICILPTHFVQITCGSLTLWVVNNAYRLVYLHLLVAGLREISYCMCSKLLELHSWSDTPLWNSLMFCGKEIAGCCSNSNVKLLLRGLFRHLFLTIASRCVIIKFEYFYAISYKCCTHPLNIISSS